MVEIGINIMHQGDRIAQRREEVSWEDFLHLTID